MQPPNKIRVERLALAEDPVGLRTQVDAGVAGGVIVMVCDEPCLRALLVLEYAGALPASVVRTAVGEAAGILSPMQKASEPYGGLLHDTARRLLTTRLVSAQRLLAAHQG